MPERATERQLPELDIVDRRNFRKAEMPSANITPPLFEALKETLSKGEQAIILYNRRGFSSYLQCTTCEEVVLCPACSIAMTYHQRKNKLLCHHCGHAHQVPNFCPSCRNPETSRIELGVDGKPVETEKTRESMGNLVHCGGGTERVIDELKELWPDARLLRMDRDSVRKKDSYREILGAMRKKEADILVGTQMIAKGHDLPSVTLVGIIDADVGLHLPDFRASEKVFQLITQAAGRAGRGSVPGRVLVQTREPNHPTIVATVTNRFKAFARYELDQRNSLGYPPWGKLLRVIISSPNQHEASSAAYATQKAAVKLAKAKDNKSLSVLGPAPAAIEKLRNR